MDSSGEYILPPLDVSTIYDIKNTTVSQLVAGQDTAILYPNFRSFLSTIAVYNNGGTLAAGTDINYWSLKAASSLSIWQYPPIVSALFSRSTFMADPPLGTYYFSHRAQPINTFNYGNMGLVINPISVNSGAAVLVGYEALARQNTIAYAGSYQQG
jgi:hypothetical protein